MRWKTERMYFAAERLFVVAAIMYLTGAIFPVLKNPSHNFDVASASDPLAFALQFSVYAIAALFMIPIRGSLLEAYKKNPVLCCLLALILISFVWSPASLFTLRKSLVFMATTAFGFYFATRFKVEEQIRLVAYALGACAVLSVVFIVALPRFGVDLLQYHGAWRGVFYHKNTFGTYMALAMVSLLCLRTRTRAGQLARFVGVALSIVLVLGSQAKGSYVVMFALILLMFLYRLLHLYWKRLIPAATIALVLLGIGGIYVASNLPTVLAVLSKDASFSGRIPLWTTVLTLSEGKRLLGFGFGGFWATNTYAVYSLVGWNASKAHNGFIDLLLDLGWVGVIIYAMNTVTAIFRSMKFVAREKTLESQWPLLVLSLILLYNLVESDLLVPNSFLWAAYVVVTVSMQRIADESRVALRNELLGDSAANEFPGSEFEPCPQ